MPEPLSFFDDTVRVSRKLMQAIRGIGDTETVDAYLTKLSEIFDLLARIHDEIARSVLEASVDPDRADHHLMGLRRENLEGAFRLRKWCDEFQRLGARLRDLGGKAGLSVAENQVWVHLCVSLEQREGEVAVLYHENLLDILDIPSAASSPDDAAQKLEDIADTLVLQKAQFDFLAKRALALRRTLG